MPRDAVVQARLERNQALLDAMMLAASADGVVKTVELKMMVARVVERPEFEGTRAEELTHLVEDSARRLSNMRSLEEVLLSLRERLPDHRNRVLGFGLACAVALADHAAHRDELGLLKKLQLALGVTEDEVAQVFDVVERGGSLSEVVGEPLARLYAETMVLVSAADGKVHEKELIRMMESMAGDPAFKGVSLDEAQQHLKESARALMSDGMTSRLTVLARGLATHGQRLKAYRLAKRIAWSDGPPKDRERTRLLLLQTTFGLSDSEAESLHGEH